MSVMSLNRTLYHTFVQGQGIKHSIPEDHIMLPSTLRYLCRNDVPKGFTSVGNIT